MPDAGPEIQFPKREILDAVVAVLLQRENWKEAGYVKCMQDEYEKLYPSQILLSAHYQEFEKQFKTFWDTHCKLFLTKYLGNPFNPPFQDQSFLYKGTTPNILLKTCLIPPLAALLGFIIDIKEMIMESIKEQRNGENAVTTFLMMSTGGVRGRMASLTT